MLATKTLVAAALGLFLTFGGQTQVTKEGFIQGSNQAGWGGKKFEGVFLPTELDKYAGENFGLTRPWDTSAIGPVMQVRLRLSDMQRESMARIKKDPTQPVLVKYEVVEAWVDPLHASGSIEVPVRTILYWAYSRPGKYENFDEVHLVKSKSGDADRYVHSGASLKSVTLETRDFFVVADGGDGVYGAEGWSVAREKSISKATRNVGAYNDAVAVYDISQTSFEGR